MHRRRDRRNDPRINIAVEQTGYRPVPAAALIAEAARRLETVRPYWTPPAQASDGSNPQDSAMDDTKHLANLYEPASRKKR